LTNEVATTHRKKNGTKKDALNYSRNTEPEAADTAAAHVRDRKISFECTRYRFKTWTGNTLSEEHKQFYS
jgi:hypothetical protein